MTTQDLKRESMYLLVMQQVRKMLALELITKGEYSRVERKIRDKYQPLIGTLFADIDLL